jgi:hypothetical protein
MSLAMAHKSPKWRRPPAPTGSRHCLRTSRKEASDEVTEVPRAGLPPSPSNRWQTIHYAIGDTARTLRLCLILLVPIIPPSVLALLVHRCSWVLTVCGNGAGEHTDSELVALPGFPPLTAGSVPYRRYRDLLSRHGERRFERIIVILSGSDADSACRSSTPFDSLKMVVGRTRLRGRRAQRTSGSLAARCASGLCRANSTSSARLPVPSA